MRYVCGPMEHRKLDCSRQLPVYGNLDAPKPTKTLLV